MKNHAYGFRENSKIFLTNTKVCIKIRTIKSKTDEKEE